MQNDILTVSQAHLSTCNNVSKRLAKTIIRAHPNNVACYVTLASVT